jgi:NADPH:quinone reductase-like Zn-dependent oxidoreductase
VLKPDNLTFEAAAAIPLAGGTALQGLRNLGKIQPGQRVLICGAGGGVGSYAVQLAKIFSTHVTAVCGPRSAELVRSLGADRVIDYSIEDFTHGSERYDLILGINGSSSLSDYRRLLAPRGIYVMVGGPLSQVFSAMLFGPLMSVGSRKFRALSAKSNPQDTTYLLQFAAEGRLKPVIERRYLLEQTAEAMRCASLGHTRGKLVISVCQDS